MCNLKHKLNHTHLSQSLLRGDGNLLNFLFRIVPSDRYHDVSKWILNIFSHEGLQYRLIELAIKFQVELAGISSEEHFFDINSIINYTITYYFQREGLDYCRCVLTPTLHLICLNNLSLEIDPERLKNSVHNMKTLEENQQMLLELCEAFLEMLFETNIQISLDISHCLKSARDILDLKASKTKLRNISRLFFTRFLIPSILLPEKMDLIDGSNKAFIKNSNQKKINSKKFESKCKFFAVPNCLNKNEIGKQSFCYFV